MSHGTVGWDGQFTAFLDIYEGLSQISDIENVRRTGELKIKSMKHRV